MSAMNIANKGRGERKRILALVVFASFISAAIGYGVASMSTPSPAASDTAHTSAHIHSHSSNGPVVNASAFFSYGNLAFISNGSLFVLDGSTKKLREVVSGKAGAEEPSFSSDGKWLAFIRAGGPTVLSGTLTLNILAPAPHLVVPGPLWIASGAGATPHLLDGFTSVESFAWNSSGHELLVVTGNSRYSGTAVWLVTPTGKARRLVKGSDMKGAAVPLPDIVGAVWSPNGKDVAVSFETSTHDTSLLKVFPTLGGVPTAWYSGNDNWLVPAGWWPN